MELQEIVRPLIEWYQANKRDLPWRWETTPYRVWISEIMLQQTRVEAVKGYFTRFIEALPDVQSLASCSEQQLLKLWEGLGYYNRARNLQKAAQVLVAQYGGQLPSDYDALLSLPGIGPYTAGAIASISYGIAQPAVDGNVLRVISRITASHADISDPATRISVGDELRKVMPVLEPGTFNQSLMELGATVCVPNGMPDCKNCPVYRLCEGRKQGVAPDLPVKTAKKPRKLEHRTILLLVRDHRIALRRRPPKGLLAGLWELPSLSGKAGQAEAVAAVRGWGLEPLRVQPLGEAKHIFTHVEWRMTGLRITVEEASPSEELVWAGPDQLREEYPLPSAFRAYLPAVEA